MESNKEQILAQFEPDIAIKLLEFSEFLSRYESDVFIFMSRKFCCLYDLLLSIGAPPVQKPIVSDKVLDQDTDFFKDKVVTIVDDIIICGTTIWKAKERLLKHYSAKEVRTVVFCVNKEWWVKECVDPDYKAVVLPDDRSMTFCSSVVNSLSIALRPYAVEFPYLSDLEIKKSNWVSLISSKDWGVYDITNKLQEDHSISVFTFFPSITILDELKKSFGECINKLLDIAKVRAYAKKLSWGIRLSILPIVIFKPLTEEGLSKVFDNFLDALHASRFDKFYLEQFKKEFKSPTSKLRLLQFAAAMVLASKFKFNLERNLDKKVLFELRDLDIELIFGKWHLPAIRTLANNYFGTEEVLFTNVLGIEPAHLDLEDTELSDLMGDTESVATAEAELDEHDFPKDDPRNLFSDFSNIFLSLYQKKEVPSKLEVRDAAPKGEWDRIRKIDRLETGITWFGILKYLKKIFNYELTPSVKDVLSLVLDYSVDKGICVPVTRYNSERKIVFRAYRHGEDVLFAEEETELCGFAIENAQNVIAKGEVPKLFLEKLLVLFIKVGVTKNILQVQYGTTGQEGIAKIGFYLHGAVVKLKKRSSLNIESNIWLSKHLLEKKVITKGSKGMYAFNQHYPAIQITSSSRTEAQKFGYILGLLYKGYQLDGNTIRIDNDDLIFLSTCFRPRDVAAALYVELDIFTIDLLPDIQMVLSQRNRSGFDKLTTYESIIENKGYTALNSLHKKTRGWNENGAKKAIDKGKEILQRLSQFTAQLDWEGYWASLEITKREDEERVFNGHIANMARVGHQLLFYVNLLEIALLKKESGHLGQDEKLRNNVDKLFSFYERTINTDPNLLSVNESQLVANLRRRIDADLELFEDEKTYRYLENRFSHFNDELSKLMPRVNSDLEVFEQRGDNTSYYDYMLWYDIVDSTASKRAVVEGEVEGYRNSVKRVKASINSFVTILEKRAKEESDQIYCWNGDEYSNNDQKYVFFSSAKEGFSLRRIKDFIERLFELANSEISFRVVVAPANTFYSELFKRFQRTEVEGDFFWEHFSRVINKFKELETEFESYKNLLLLIGNGSRPLNSDKFSLRQKLWQGKIVTEIGAGQLKTLGELWVAK